MSQSISEHTWSFIVHQTKPGNIKLFWEILKAKVIFVMLAKVMAVIINKAV
jgi:hypothetical protein